LNAGKATQGNDSVAIGTSAGQNSQASQSVAIGINAGVTSQGNSSVAIGYNAGNNAQSSYSLAIGGSSGQVSQGQQGVAVGYSAGNNYQGIGAVAVGSSAGNNTQGQNAVAIGNSAGNNAQATAAVAIGIFAGYYTQGQNSIAIGQRSGMTSQASQAIAIGYNAGANTQGANAVAIGYGAGQTSQPSNSIVINATGSGLSGATASAFYVNPIRQAATTGTSGVLQWDTNTNEVLYNTAKTFVIEHPTDSAKYLVHACLEGPEAGVYYRGESEIAEGQTMTNVQLPDYVDKFATDLTIQITAIYNGKVRVLNYSRVENNSFNVYCNEGDHGPFSWTVHGKRGSIDVEPNKADVELHGSGPYKYLTN
jgi:hypothetical protein